MKTEYEILREEIIKWQDRRFELLKISITVVTGLLGFKLVTEHFSSAASNNVVWPYISAVLLLFLAATNLLTWYCGLANVKIASYLRVFHEANEFTTGQMQWESRLKRFDMSYLSYLDKKNLNFWLAIVYFVLGIISVIIPWAAAEFVLPEDGLSIILLAFSVCCFAMVLTILSQHVDWRKQREIFEKKWSWVAEEEKAQ